MFERVEEARVANEEKKCIKLKRQGATFSWEVLDTVAIKTVGKEATIDSHKIK